MEKQNIVAKAISCYEVSHMWEDVNERPGLCIVCHSAVEQIPNMEYKVRKAKSRDLVCTYDGFYIASQKFKDFCDENGYEDIRRLTAKLGLCILNLTQRQEIKTFI